MSSKRLITLPGLRIKSSSNCACLGVKRCSVGPLSKERFRERGYNQAAAVAHPLALFLERPYQPFSLEQVRDTRSQVGLSAEERRLNVVDAFEAVPELVHKKDILLIDDVKTTGATLSACAGALKIAGADNVFCVTIARFSG